jgi:hypothetical protein
MVMNLLLKVALMNVKRPLRLKIAVINVKRSLSWYVWKYKWKSDVHFNLAFLICGLGNEWKFNFSMSEFSFLFYTFEGHLNKDNVRMNVA